jgi:hypothetical protein
MAISDDFVFKYDVIKPSSGLIKDSIMSMTRLVNGADLGLDSLWTITKVGRKISIQPLNSPSIWSKRKTSSSFIRMNFIKR